MELSTLERGDTYAHAACRVTQADYQEMITTEEQDKKDAPFNRVVERML